MHWCMDETLAVLAMIPFIGYFFRKLHIWWHNKFHHKCHEKGCDSNHVEHKDDPYSPFNRDPRDGMLTRGDVLIICGWDSLTQDDVEERFGGCLIDDLIGDDYLLGVDERPADDEFRWFVNDKQELRAVFKERVFAHDYECCEHGWREICADDLGAELKAKW